MRFTSLPRFHDISAYENAIDSACERLKKNTSLVSLYQIGSISSPGISDIDLVVIYPDDYFTSYNPLADLLPEEKYFFVHSFFGTAESQFAKLNNFLLQVKYKLLFGKEIVQPANSYTREEVKEMELQIAAEYILKNLLSVYRQQRFGVVKLRSLLLEANALKYDFELLGIKSGELYNLVFELIEWRKSWFSSQPSFQQLNKWFQSYCRSLYEFAKSFFDHYNLLSSIDAPFLIMKKIKVQSARALSLYSSGFIVPQIPFINPLTILKISQRTTQFSLELPVQKPLINSINQKRFNALKEMQEYNQKFLPYFQPMTSVLPELYM